jgi:hypothetical protein
VKPIKMLGLAALAALMAMAFVGASSAMAESTALCKADEEKCSEANTITHVHETSVGKAILLGSPKVECNVLFLGDTLAGSAAPLVIEGTFTYTSCTNFCTAKEENGPSEIQVLKTAEELGAVTGEGLVHLTCPFGINCFYNGEGLEGHATGPLKSAQANGSVVLTEQETTKESGSGICPEEGFLDITTAPLIKTYIAKSSLKDLCVEVGANNGLFLDSECTEKHSTRIGEYALGWVLPGTPEGEMVCIFVGAHNGYYLDQGTWEKCEEEDASRLGSWELGITI